MDKPLVTSPRDQPYDPVMTSHVVDQPGPTLVIHGGAGNVPSRTGEAVSYTHLTLPTIYSV